MIEALFADWRPSELTLPFWEGARRHRPVLQRCAGCGAWQHPPRPVCVRCGGSGVDLRWEPIGGEGRICSFTVVARGLLPALREQVPYVLALVELGEGPRLVTVVDAIEPAAARLDLPVAMAFLPFGDGFELPVFRPIKEYAKKDRALAEPPLVEEER